MGKGWEMKLSLQDVLKRGHELGDRGGAGLEHSTTSGRGGPMVQELRREGEGKNRKQKDVRHWKDASGHRKCSHTQN